MAVLELGISVMYRNATFANQEGGIEACDGVAGAVPAKYEHLPTAEDALQTYKSALKKLHAGLGESIAPSAKAPKAEDDADDNSNDEDGPKKATSGGKDAPVWNGGKK